MSAVCLVQGASRGIGLGFCRALLARSSDSLVIATSRKPGTASELQHLQIQYPQRLTVLSVDVTDSRQIEDAANFVKNQLGRLDLLINSAGILHPSGKGETSLRDVNQEERERDCLVDKGQMPSSIIQQYLSIYQHMLAPLQTMVLVAGTATGCPKQLSIWQPKTSALSWEEEGKK